MRKLRTALLAAALIITPTFARAEWPEDGTPLVQGHYSGNLTMASDGAGGAYVAWIGDNTLGGTMFVQRVTANGVIAAGWPAVGLPVSYLPGAEQYGQIVADGFGGVLAVCQDFRNQDERLYMQRFLSDGSVAPGWPQNGSVVSTSNGYQNGARMQPDGAGGAFVVWENSGDYDDEDIFIQHMMSDGTVAAGWPLDGIPVCALPTFSGQPSIDGDDSGGVFVTWVDARSGHAQIYVQRIGQNGEVAPGWTSNGVLVANGPVTSICTRDNAGGLYIAMGTLSSYYAMADLYLQRLTSAGTPAPGWPPGGQRVCGGPLFRDKLNLRPDGFGGALVAWYEVRAAVRVRVYGSRFSPSGALAPGWAVGGRSVSGPDSVDTDYGDDPTWNDAIAADGAGGEFVTWPRRYDEYGYRWLTFIQHVTGQGTPAPGWPNDGIRVSTSTYQIEPHIISDGHGGAIVAWVEDCCGRIGVFARRFAADGPVAVELSLVSAEARDGHIALDWFAAAGSLSSATISRRTDSSSWAMLGTVAADGTGHLRFEDRDVTPGHRYGYRLGYYDDGVDLVSAETWVDVPAARLALEGLRPNPASGALTISFALPDASPASLEVLDVSGRRIVQREVGSLGPGSHLVRIDDGASFAPGIYWLRLRQGARALLARGAVVR